MLSEGRVDCAQCSWFQAGGTVKSQLEAYGRHLGRGHLS